MAKNRNKPTSGVPSPVKQVRTVPDFTRALLLVQAGGRCEFDGHNEYLMEHPVTRTWGNFAQFAHIVAFEEAGPRGDDPARPVDIHDPSNLMLLCPTCHKLIDDNPTVWTRAVLEEHKKAHEARICHVTSLGPDRSTTVLVVKSRVRNAPVAFPYAQIVAATTPRWPSSRNPLEIDLASLPDDVPTYIETACSAIRRHIQDFLRPGSEVYKTQHISVFALARIPLLAFLGKELGNKIPTDLYQRHRNPEDWAWRTDGEPVQYDFREVQKGSSSRVALVLSLSGTIPASSLPTDIHETATVYEITLSGQTPSPTFLRLRQDLASFITIYLQALSHILASHGFLEFIDLFPAVPAPIAILCGRELLPNVHPSLRVYDRDEHGRYSLALTINNR